MEIDEKEFAAALLFARKRGLEDGANACDEMVKLAEKQNEPPTPSGDLIVETMRMVARGVREYPVLTLEDVMEAIKEN